MPQPACDVCLLGLSSVAGFGRAPLTALTGLAVVDFSGLLTGVYYKPNFVLPSLLVFAGRFL